MTIQKLIMISPEKLTKIGVEKSTNSRCYKNIIIEKNFFLSFFCLRSHFVRTKKLKFEKKTTDEKLI